MADLKFPSLEAVPGHPTHLAEDIPHVDSLHGAPIVVDMRSVDDLKLGLNLPVLDNESRNFIMNGMNRTKTPTYMTNGL